MATPLQQILNEVRRVELVSRRAVRDLLSGQYRSAFKGRGILFDEVREYQPGDEVRFIDWNITARMNAPFVKQFTEEREMSVLIGLDTSRSMLFGSAGKSKRSTAIETAAMLAFSAITNQDKVGLFLFDGKVEGHTPVKKGRRHALRLIRDMVDPPGSDNEGNGMEAALGFLHHAHLRRSLVILISDFIELSEAPERHRSALQQGNHRHDLCLLRVTDARESDLPDVGRVVLEDAETGDTRVINTADAAFRERYRESAQARTSRLDQLLRSVGVDHQDISTGDDIPMALSRFFSMRARKRPGARTLSIILVFLSLLAQPSARAASGQALIEEMEKELADIPLEQLEPSPPAPEFDIPSPARWLGWAGLLVPIVAGVYLGMDRWIAPRQLKQATTHQDPRLDAIQALDGLSPDDPELPDKLAKALRQFLQGALGIKTEDKSLEELIPGTDSLARASDWRVLLHSLEDRRFSRGNPPLDNLLEAARSLVREDMCPRTET